MYAATNQMRSENPMAAIAELIRIAAAYSSIVSAMNPARAVMIAPPYAKEKLPKSKVAVRSLLRLIPMNR